MNTKEVAYLFGKNSYIKIDKDPIHDPDAKKCYIIKLNDEYIPVFAGDEVSTDLRNDITIIKNMKLIQDNPYNYILCDEVDVKDGPDLPLPILSDFMPPKLFGVDVDELVNNKPFLGYLFDNYHNRFNINFIIASAANMAGLYSEQVFENPPVKGVPLEISDIKPPYREEVQKFLDGVSNNGWVPISYWDDKDYCTRAYGTGGRETVYDQPYPFIVWFFNSKAWFLEKCRSDIKLS